MALRIPDMNVLRTSQKTCPDLLAEREFSKSEEVLFVTLMKSLRQWKWQARLFPFLLMGTLCLISACADDAKTRFRVVGYLPEYRFSRLDEDQTTMLTDLILFAAEPDQEGLVVMGRVSSAPWEKLWELRRQHGTRLILCVGGWERSTSFSEVVHSPVKRQRLVKSLVDILLDRKLNGLDLDWESPQSTADWEGYTQLLQQLQTAFRPHGLSLSITVAPWRDLPEKAWQAVDQVQLMSYDYGQQHSTPQQAQRDIQSFLDRKVPAEKIILGVPFYGRSIADRKAMTYSRIVSRFQPQPDIDEVEGIYFNGPDTIHRKTRAALEAGLGGVMIWEIGQDTLDETSLLRRIRQTIDTDRPFAPPTSPRP